MSSKLQNPVVVGTLSVMMSVGLGLALTWRTLNSLVLPTAAPVVNPETNELKKKGWDFWTIEIEGLSNELKDEKVRLRKQAELLDMRAARVAAEEKEFAKLRAEIESMRAQITEKILEISADESKNIRTLATTYSGLTPKAAVAIFKELDDTTAVKILSIMKPDVVGPIFEEMSKTAGTDGPLAKRVALLSERLRLVKAAKAAKSS